MLKSRAELRAPYATKCLYRGIGIENDTQQMQKTPSGYFCSVFLLTPPPQPQVSKTIPGSRECREFNENRENSIAKLPKFFNLTKWLKAKSLFFK